MLKVVFNVWMLHVHVYSFKLDDFGLPHNFMTPLADISTLYIETYNKIMLFAEQSFFASLSLWRWFFVHESKRVAVNLIILLTYGPGSSVGMVTDYGLDDPGSNPGGDEIFRPSRTALEPTRSPVKWVPGLSRG